MTALSTSPETLSDAELISAVRGGDVEAYGTLFERHAEAARRLARQLVSAGDAEDLVSEAFVKVLTVLQRGGGPDVAFRAYLLTAVRRLRVDRLRAGSKLHTTDDMEAFDPGVPFRDTAVEGFENAAAAKAFASLPERWQLVLWHTEVEGSKPADIAPLLGMSANSVSALAYRAREGLRQAFLSQHAAELEDDTCRWTHQQLGAYVRNAIARRDAAKVEAHLQECRPCTAVYLELTEVNSNLSAILAPLLLGGVATAYVASVSTSAPVGVALVLGRLRDLVVQNAATSAVAGVASSVAVVGAVAVIAGGGTAPLPSDPTAAPSLVPSSSAAVAGVEPETTKERAADPRVQAATAPVVVALPATDTIPVPVTTEPPVPVPTPVETTEAVPTPTPTATPTSSPTATPTATPTGTPTSIPTATPTASPPVPPTPTVTPPVPPTPVVTPPVTPPVTPTPTLEPSTSPTGSPTSEPTGSPTDEPSVPPTDDPTDDPSVPPTDDPTASPTDEPTVTPTDEPTATPVDLVLELDSPAPVAGRRNVWNLEATVRGLPSGMSGVITFTTEDVSTMTAPGCERSNGNRTVTCEFETDPFSVVLEATAPQGGTITAVATAIADDGRVEGQWVLPAPTAAP